MAYHIRTSQGGVEMKTATEVEPEGVALQDARQVALQVIERLQRGHGHKTWGRQGAMLYSGRTFSVTDARFGANCHDTFKMFGNHEEGDGAFGWKANVNHMEVWKLPHGTVLTDKLGKYPPIVLMM